MVRLRHSFLEELAHNPTRQRFQSLLVVKKKTLVIFLLCLFDCVTLGHRALMRNACDSVINCVVFGGETKRVRAADGCVKREPPQWESRALTQTEERPDDERQRRGGTSHRYISQKDKRALILCLVALMASVMAA